MNPLNGLIVRQIEHAGPMSLGEYMSICLMHPEFGYYTRGHPMGAAGAFTTAPEISQMFGELVGLWLAQCWIDEGSPKKFTLCELGPGYGTLMADILRATRGVEGFARACQPLLIEQSEPLRSRQKETLAGHEVKWGGSASEIPECPLLLVANEFFDALPMRQFIRCVGYWREIQVGVSNGRLLFGHSEPIPIQRVGVNAAAAAPGEIVEVRTSATQIIQEVSQRIGKHGGVALILDYGAEKSAGDTFQAVRSHRPVDPLDEPGTADLSAHVDFGALVAASLVPSTQLTTQGAFLKSIGIEERAKRLAENLIGPDLDSHYAALRRLTCPNEMGDLFKVLALYPINAPCPPGFA